MTLKFPSELAEGIALQTGDVHLGHAQPLCDIGLRQSSVEFQVYMEGLSAIDTLNEADLLVYRDDNHIHMQPSRARSFCQSLQELHRVVTANLGTGGNGMEVRGGKEAVFH